MIRTSNIKARQYVTNMKLFKGNNVFSEIVNETYIVYSYGHHFPMYINKAGQWYKNKCRYSVSTSRHQSQCHPLVDNIIELSTAEMKGIIYAK